LSPEKETGTLASVTLLAIVKGKGDDVRVGDGFGETDLLDAVVGDERAGDVDR